MCVYKDEWTKVQWNAEAKTYAVGVRVPQLDKYDTKGSDIQVLVNEELERTSKEDSTSEAESEEELKEPGASIDQQIHLAPIDQTLRTSPIETKNHLPLLEATMTTQTTTSVSTAITSSQPTTSSSTTTNATTPQKLHNQLQQILRRHGGGSGGPNGPGGPGGPGGSGGPGSPGGPNPATPQQPIQPAADVKTMGALPQLFYRDRTKANDFIDKVKAYLCLNADVTGYDSPFKKVAFTLTLIKGESTAQWVRDMGNWLNALVIPRDNIPGLWDQFLTEF